MKLPVIKCAFHFESDFINRKVNTPSKETVMKPGVYGLGFQVLKMQLHP